MKNKLLAVLLGLLLPLYAQQWRLALPDFQYQFPRDHFNHPDYQTEWWYYTGNLRAADGRRFGFELTFFRISVHLPKQVAEHSGTTWRPDQIHLAHLALSDLDGGKFYHEERLNRSGPGLAGAGFDAQRYWNGNWQVRWKSLPGADQELQAVSDQFTLKLSLHPAKPFVINGPNGLSQKGPQPGDASHYISFTRLVAKGDLHLQNKTLMVDGLAWMDHEFFSQPRNSSLAGWDWFAIQLDNGEELMLYRLRQKSGEPDTYSSGTFIDAHGGAHFLKWNDFSLQPGAQWQSLLSKASYPIEWTIDVPCLQLHLLQTTPLKNQELFSKSGVTPSYWEGAVTYVGQIHSQAVRGAGYLEMTGHDKAVWLRQR